MSMLLKISKFFLYASVFSVVIVMTSTFFPFIGGKDYFFRFSVELAAIFFILWLAFETKGGEVLNRLREVFGRPLFVAVSVFMLVVLLSTIFAYDPNAAFWSNYERGDGGFQMLHYYTFFVLLVLLLEKKEDWRLLFKISVFAAVLMILYGVFANLGWADNFISPYQGGKVPTTLWQRLVEARFQGSLGNPAYVAPYLLFSLFYVAYLWFGSQFKNKRLGSLIYGGLFIVFLFFFILSQTRGGLLGLGAGLFVFIVYLIIAIPRLRKWLIPVFVALVLLGSSLVYFRQSDFIKKKIPGGRIFDIAFSEQTVNTRLWTWGSAWNGFKERPVLGWGLENFSAVFDKYFDPRHFVPGKNTETWFDRAHSLFFDYLAETGILGLLSYLGIFVVFFISLFSKIIKGTKTSPIMIALLFSLPVAYLVQGAAIFDVLPIYINLFLFFAFSYHFLYTNETTN